MTGWVRRSYLNADALVFPPSDEPPRHVPTWRYDLPTGWVVCGRCLGVINLHDQWARPETCGGQT